MLFSLDFLILASKLICVLIYSSLFKWNVYSLKIVQNSCEILYDIK